ncbi:amino acid ABC transporter substrate-binding protein [Desemzia sp. RIT 804]|uniref:amino acid ABC transporter substrate-binding protein n=1 Tax=Desemzia sp. RIT 804 TaxID=2810209 RepID=UPI001F2C5A92|nr:amino acid ABC transporter substrate-binding protein [Desemzia sp. RIT 804]
MRLKKIKMICSVLMLSMFLMACGKANTAATNKKEIFLGESGDTFVIGLDDTFVPMGFRDNEGNLVGLDVDLANEAAKRLELEIKFQPIDWAMKETELNSGKIDAIWNGYSMTEERKEKVDFSTPYHQSGQVFVVLENSPIETWEDLAGKVVASQQSSSTVDLLENHESGIIDTFANGEIIQYPSYNDVFNDLESGRSEAVAVSELYARYYMKQKGEEQYRILEEGFGYEDTAVGVRKSDTEFLEKLNAVLAEMEEDGTLKDIKSKWITE